MSKVAEALPDAKLLAVLKAIAIKVANAVKGAGSGLKKSLPGAETSQNPAAPTPPKQKSPAPTPSKQKTTPPTKQKTTPPTPPKPKTSPSKSS